MVEPDGTPGRNPEGGEPDGASSGTPRYSEDDVKRMLQESLEGHEAYKSMQRAMSKLASENQAKLAAKDAELNDLRSNQRSMTEGFDYLTKVVMSALPDEERDRVLGELREKRLERVERQNEELRQVMSRPVQNPMQRPPEADDEFEAELKKILAEARESLEDAVRSHGLDPKAKGLDYGDEKEPFARRLKKLNASIAGLKKAEEDQELAEVRSRTPAPQTRVTPEGRPFDTYGDDLLKRGSDELWARLQKEYRETAPSRGRR